MNETGLNGLTIGGNVGLTVPIDGDMTGLFVSTNIPSTLTMVESKTISPFERLVARVEKIEQWIEWQKQR